MVSVFAVMGAADHLDGQLTPFKEFQKACPSPMDAAFDCPHGAAANFSRLFVAEPLSADEHDCFSHRGLKAAQCFLQVLVAHPIILLRRPSKSRIPIINYVNRDIIDGVPPHDGNKVIPKDSE